MLTYDEALHALLDAAEPVEETREMALEAAVGRVLAEDIRARVNVPSLDNSAMDGYAGRAAEMGASHATGLALPVSQRIPAGTRGEPLALGSVARIFTGAPLPDGADVVVMQEQCEATAEGVRFQVAPRPGEHVRRAGEDMRSGEVILSAGTRLHPQHLALAAAAGWPRLPVWRRLRVALLVTGDELVQPGQPLPPGATYDSNRYALAAQLEALGCDVRVVGPVADDFDATRVALAEMAASNDLVVTSGGVSVGEEDHVKAAVESIGSLSLWKVAIKPGKPLAFGRIETAGKRTWYIGLPGNPVSSFVTFTTLVRPFVLRLQGQKQVLPRKFLLPAAFGRDGRETRTEFLRVRIDGEGRLELLAKQGSAAVTSLVWAHGLVQLPPGRAVDIGEPVEFLPFSELL